MERGTDLGQMDAATTRAQSQLSDSAARRAVHHIFCFNATLVEAEKQAKIRTINQEANRQFKEILTSEQWTKFVETRKSLNEKNKSAAPTNKKP
jgi:predicted nucleic acid-binding protein